MSTKKIIGGTGITAGRDVTFGDNTGLIATGKNITQTQTLSSSDKEELRDSLVQFQKEITKLNLPADTMATVNGDVTAAIKEVEKEKPEPSKYFFMAITPVISSIYYFIRIIPISGIIGTIIGFILKQINTGRKHAN